MTEQQSKGAGLLLHNTLPNKEAYSNISVFFKTSVIKIYIFIYLLGEGNGNPLQYSCLEKSMDRGAWPHMTEHVCTRVEGDGLVAIKW